jgi:uncharacterized protein (DUF433 family)
MAGSLSDSGQKLYKTLITPTYTLTEASQLAGVSKWRVSSWLRGYEYHYSVGDEIRDGKQAPVIKHSNEPQASFLDLIDLLFVKRFLRQGFSLQYLRKALDEACDLLGTPHFARSTFFTSEKQITLQLKKDSKYMITLLTGGQSAMSQVVEYLDDKVEFEDVTGLGLANRWYPKGKNGLIVVDPQIAFGRPTLVGRGIATENIYDLYLGENERIEPVSHWFNVPRNEIKAAVSFQSHLVGV